MTVLDFVAVWLNAVLQPDGSILYSDEMVSLCFVAEWLNFVLYPGELKGMYPQMNFFKTYFTKLSMIKKFLEYPKSLPSDIFSQLQAWTV